MIFAIQNALLSCYPLVFEGTLVSNDMVPDLNLEKDHMDVAQENLFL